MRKLFVVISLLCCLSATRGSVSEKEPAPEHYLKCQAGKTLPLQRACPAIEKKAPELTKPIKIRLIFIRHAESEWNHDKNGKVSQLYAWAFRYAGWYDDASLSLAGVKQSLALQKEILKDRRHDADWDVLRNQAPRTVRIVATSNLKRAPMTLLIALQGQLGSLKSDGGVHVLSSLQEASSGRDARSSTGKQDPPHIFPSGLDENNKDCPFRKESLMKLFDTGCNKGNHAERTTEEKIEAFSAWVRTQVENELAKERQAPIEDGKHRFNQTPQKDGPIYLLVAGHSSWLRDFFKSKLPLETKQVKGKYFFSSSTTEIVTRISGIEEQLLPGTKLFNTGMIATTLELGATHKETFLKIIPGSTRLLYSIKEGAERNLVDQEPQPALDEQYRPTPIGEYLEAPLTVENLNAHRDGGDMSVGSRTVSTSAESVSSVLSSSAGGQELIPYGIPSFDIDPEDDEVEGRERSNSVTSDMTDRDSVDTIPSKEEGVGMVDVHEQKQRPITVG